MFKSFNLPFAFLVTVNSEAIALAPHALEDATHPPFALYDSVNLVIPIKALFSVYPIANSHVKAWRTTEPRLLHAASSIVLIQSPEHLTALNCRKRLLRPIPNSNRVKVGLQQEYFDAIQAGSKTWEGRIDRGIYKTIAPGDQILFYSNQDPSQTLLRIVLCVERYPDFASMLQDKHQSFLPHSTFSSAVETYLALPGYSSAINTHGAVAFQLSPLSPDAELRFNTALLSIHQNSKAPPLWSHRRWLLSHFDLEDDPLIARKACEGYKRNYAAWTHRLLSSDAPSRSGELENALEWFSRNPGDWSCASFLIRLVGSGERDRVWEVVKENVRRYGRESSWLALRALADCERSEEGLKVCDEMLRGDIEGRQGVEAIKWARRTRTFLRWRVSREV